MCGDCKSIACLTMLILVVFSGCSGKESSNADSDAQERSQAVTAIVNSENLTRVGDVVFVHGLGGDGKATWHPVGKPNSYWPAWLGEDMPHVGVWSIDYEASASAWLGGTMPIKDRANNILERLIADGIGTQRPVVFVTHSLGGLVVKEMLHQSLSLNNPEWEKVGRNTRGVVFLATPHTGSGGADLAIYLDSLTKVLDVTTSIDDLRANAPELRTLNLWYRNNAERSGIATKVFYEKQLTYGIQVVNETTADPGMQGVFPIAVDADHNSICKPESRNNFLYKRVRSFIHELLGEGGDVTKYTLIDLSSGSGPSYLSCLGDIWTSTLGPLSPEAIAEVQQARDNNDYSPPDVDRIVFQSDAVSRFVEPPMVGIPAGIKAKIMVFVLDQTGATCRIVNRPAEFHDGGQFVFRSVRLKAKFASCTLCIL